MLYTENERLNEHDRTVLLGDDAYRHYFSFMKNVFERVLTAYQLDVEGRQDEVALLQYFLVRLLNSINCLGTKYSFEIDFKLKIDQSDSSYPNAYEFRMLQDDIKDRNAQLEVIRSKEVLINELIESIFANKDTLQRTQHQLALRTYYDSLANKDSLFLPFTPGQLTELSTRGGRYRYMYTWGIFEDTLDVPMIFRLEFESQKGFDGSLGDSKFKAFLKDLQYASTYSLKLFEIASYLSKTCDDIYPKSIKRLTVGPLHGKYSTSNNMIAPFLNKHQSPEVFALEVQSELVVSIDETQPDQGKKPQQVFVVGKTSEMMHRKVSDCRQLLFAPHKVGQLLHTTKGLKEEVLKYQIVSLKKLANG